MMDIQQLLTHENFFYYGEPLNLLSIFDDTRYDRSDIDVLNSAQRDFLLNKLKRHGYKWKSGRVLHSATSPYAFTFPKISVLGASPIDAIKNETSSEHNVIVVTPTQFCAQCLVMLDKEKGPELIKELIVKHPVNLLKLRDHLSYTEYAEYYDKILPALLSIQKQAVETGRLKTKKHIGAM